MPNWKRAGKLTLIGLLLMPLVAGCQHRNTIPTTGITDAIPCDRLAPIRYSGKGDTGLTVEQIRQFNAAYDAVCKRG